MKKISLMLVLAFALQLGITSICHAQKKVDEEWIIIPGERVGMITKDLKREELTRHFNRRIIQDEVLTVEDKALYTTTLYKGTANDLRIFWTDKTKTAVDKVLIEGYIGSRWHTADQLHVGIQVYPNLIDINNDDLLFSGFTNEQAGGLVTNWGQEGLLKKYDEDLTVQLWYSGSCELTELNSYDFLEKKEYSTAAQQTQFLELRVYKLHVEL